MGETRSRARHEKTRRNRKIENSAAISTLRTRVVVCASLVLVAGAFLLSEVSLTSRVRTWAGVMLEKSSSKSTFLPGTQPSPVVETPAPQLATVTQAPQVPSPVATPTEAPKERGEVQGAPIEAAPRVLKSCLSFVHIPKAGGSNIEGIIARAYGYNQVVENPGDCISMRKIEKDVRFWGMCDDRLRCETKKHCGWSGADCCFINKSFEPQPPKNTGVDRCSFWHFPPAWDSQLATTYTQECDAFCVVREPVSRYLSHWRWRHLQKTGCSAEALEKFTKEKLAKAQGNEYLLEDCHFTPQVFYAFYNGNPANGRICQHILKLENLHQEFDPLMKKYGYPDKVKLGKSKSRASHGCSITPTEETLRLIKEYYAEDFKAFGY